MAITRGAQILAAGYLILYSGANIFSIIIEVFFLY